MQILMPSYVGCSSLQCKSSMVNFYFSIKKGEYEKGFDYLKTFLASIPNELNNKKEKDYQTILYVLFTWLGFYTQVEVSTAIGRMDMVIYTKTNIYIFEFKVNKSAEEAMKQIHERNYEVKFKNDGREIVKFGINISSKKRTIDKWIMEK